MEGVSQLLQFKHYCELFVTSFICTCRDLNSCRNCVLSLNLGQIKSCSAGKLFSYVATSYCLSRHK